MMVGMAVADMVVEEGMGGVVVVMDAVVDMVGEVGVGIVKGGRAR